MKLNRPIRLCPAAFHRGGFLLLLLLFTTLTADAANFQDYFTNRETILTTNGTMLGDNSAATFEVGEPKHGGKVGGHSLWISWVAPTNGVVTFDTHGSSFDTLLSGYTLNPTNATTVDKLHEEARNDDDPLAPPTSIIQIGAIVGHHYEIAVDGYQGATGSVVFHWSFVPSASPPPIIVSTPNDQAAKMGDTINLSVNMATSPNLQLAWFFNGIEDTNQTGTNFVINSLQDTNVGRYQLRVTIGNGNNRVRYFTTPAEIQINSDGSTNTLAEDKLLDSTSTPLIGEAGGGGPGGGVVGGGVITQPLSKVFFSRIQAATASASTIGVVRGYNGSQVFNTTFATTDPNEPLHCGTTGGSSYWLMYQPPTNGLMTFDTIKSSYDTVMEVYTYNSALNSYADLISVGCDNDSISPHGPSRVSFQAVKARPYIVVVDGVNGVKGTAWLNYLLNTNLPALPPTLQSPITVQAVTPGSTVTLTPSITGAPPMNFSWKKGGVSLQNVATPFLQLTNVTIPDSGVYTLFVTNDLGTMTLNIPVHVISPPRCNATRVSGNVTLSFPTETNLQYTILQATNISGPWSPWAGAFPGNGQTFSTNITGPGSRFFRVSIQ